MAGIASKFAHLNPFGGKPKRDEDDYGEAIDADSVAGGGHSLRPTNITKEGLRVSKALKKFLVDQHVLSPTDVDVQSDETSGPLKELLDLPHVHVPRELTQRGHPLTEYFISSSHNTYLLAHQLYGSSSATAYETALNSGARCLEIDAWDNSENQDEPKVTHGYSKLSREMHICELRMH
jgi:phosphatidylinositol phospholipase C delta